jgi:hypothetical protein
MTGPGANLGPAPGSDRAPQASRRNVVIEMLPVRRPTGREDARGPCELDLFDA